MSENYKLDAHQVFYLETGVPVLGGWLRDWDLPDELVRAVSKRPSLEVARLSFVKGKMNHWRWVQVAELLPLVQCVTPAELLRRYMDLSYRYFGNDSIAVMADPDTRTVEEVRRRARSTQFYVLRDVVAMTYSPKPQSWIPAPLAKQILHTFHCALAQGVRPEQIYVVGRMDEDDPLRIVPVVQAAEVDLPQQPYFNWCVERNYGQ